MARPSVLRNVNLWAGTFVVVGVLLFVAAVFTAGRLQRWFDPVERMRISLPEEGLSGLREGADVRILGAVVGQVEEISVDQTGSMEATLSIRRDFYNFVRVDSQVVIRQRFGLVAEDAYIEISRGTGDPLRPDIVVPATPEKDIKALIKETLGQSNSMLQEALDEYRGLATDLRDPRKPFQQALTNINDIVAKVNRGEGLAGRMVGDAKLAERLEETLAKLDGAVADFREAAKKLPEVAETIKAQADGMTPIRERSAEVLEDMGVVLKQLQETLEHLPEVAARVRGEAEDLPGLVLHTRETLEEIRRLIVGVQKHWMIRDYVEPETPPGRIPPTDVGLPRTEP